MLHIFCIFFNFFSVLKFYENRSFTSLVGFIPRYSISLNFVLFSNVLLSSSWKKFNFLSFIFPFSKILSSLGRNRGHHQMLSVCGSESYLLGPYSRIHFPKTDLEYPGIAKFYFIIVCVHVCFSTLSQFPLSFMFTVF